MLADDLVVTPDNPVPYFMFNLCEPGDEELKEIRKTQRRKNLLKIEEKDWWRKVTSRYAGTLGVLAGCCRRVRTVVKTRRRLALFHPFVLISWGKKLLYCWTDFAHLRFV